MTGTIGSLNVSVAAGILLYEIIRQRSAVFLFDNASYPLIKHRLVSGK